MSYHHLASGKSKLNCMSMPTACVCQQKHVAYLTLTSFKHVQNKQKQDTKEKQISSLTYSLTVG